MPKLKNGEMVVLKVSMMMRANTATHYLLRRRVRRREVTNVVRKSNARNRRGKRFTVCIHFPIGLSLFLSLSRLRLIYAHSRAHTFTSDITREHTRLASFLSFSLSLSVCVYVRWFCMKRKKNRKVRKLFPQSFPLSQLA